MHASLLLIGVLFLFSRHIQAAPSDNRGLDEPPGHPGKHPDHGTQSPGITDFDFDMAIWNTTVPPPNEEQPDDPPRPLEKDKRDESSDYEECRPLDKKKFLSRDIMIDAVGRLCEDAHGRSQDKNTRGVSRTYNSGTPDEVDISLSLPSNL
ncbi:hypothetical protein IMZ48_45560 [Candidatus Bathyarchaeota archaeon]|nr:hypothetical protein [Candidatus Bathyarchaeota archaeon]